MSGKDTNSFTKKRSRRKSSENFKSPSENENDDTKRFSYYLRKYNEATNQPFPKICHYTIKDDKRVIQSDPLTETRDEHVHEPVINVYCDTGSSLKKIVCRVPNMEAELVSALGRTITNFENLITLRLKNCGLTSQHVRCLADGLKFKTLTELSLNGNPNEEQNFHLLLDRGLKVLSLKMCGINVEGLRQMADKFSSCSLNSTLVHLDLSSNMVFDEGCRPLAKILRCDRTLRSLNLSDCKIRDEGIQTIMNNFRKFSLWTEEIYTRRKLRFQYYKLLQKVIEEKENAADTKCNEESGKDDLTAVEEILRKHPFTSESTEENGEVFCRGNYTLERLNLSYNHLSKASLDFILQCLMKQSGAFGIEKGLNRVVLDGHPDDATQVRNVIDELLSDKKRKVSVNGSAKVRSIAKKRKSSGASSISGGIKDRESRDRKIF